MSSLLQPTHLQDRLDVQNNIPWTHALPVIGVLLYAQHHVQQAATSSNNTMTHSKIVAFGECLLLGLFLSSLKGLYYFYTNFFTPLIENKNGLVIYQSIHSVHGIIALFCSIGILTFLLYVGFKRIHIDTTNGNEIHQQAKIIDFTLPPLEHLKYHFQSHTSGLLGLYIISFLILMVGLTPFLTPYHPNTIDIGPALTAPSFDYLLGTDEFGRDCFTRILYGGRISLFIGFIAVVLSITIGTTIGIIAGFYGGVIDKALMWCVDLILALPRLVLLLAIVGFFRASGAQSLLLIVVILGLTGWMSIARMVRSKVLSLKEQDFISATKALGLPTYRILFFHLLPNTLSPVIVNASLAIGSTILVEAALSFLGLGIPPPTATWGSLVNEGREVLRTAPWITFFPGLFIVAAVMGFNMIGDGLRDGLDPKTH